MRSHLIASFQPSIMVYLSVYKSPSLFPPFPEPTLRTIIHQSEDQELLSKNDFVSSARSWSKPNMDQILRINAGAWRNRYSHHTYRRTCEKMLKKNNCHTAAHSIHIQLQSLTRKTLSIGQPAFSAWPVEKNTNDYRNLVPKHQWACEPAPVSNPVPFRALEYICYQHLHHKRHYQHSFLPYVILPSASNPRTLTQTLAAEQAYQKTRTEHLFNLISLLWRTHPVTSCFPKKFISLVTNFSAHRGWVTKDAPWLQQIWKQTGRSEMKWIPVQGARCLRFLWD